MTNIPTKELFKRAVLVVDDEPHFLTSIKITLRHFGIERVATCDDSRTALDSLRNGAYSGVLLDITMPHLSGTILLKQILREFPDVPVIMITAVNEVEVAVSCIKDGAFDYLVKPIEEDRLATTIHNAFGFADVCKENCSLRNTLLSGNLQKPEAFAEFVTQNASLIGVFSYIEAIAPSRNSVLITGETGTGKELIARAIHDSSSRQGPYLPVNVAGMAETMIDDELFGHSKGAFTGAQADRSGMVEKAAGGTLFLDEIGDLALSMQVKLLRLIQEGQYQKLGSDDIQQSDARIIVATNLDVEDRVSKGSFRADLYYRLATHRVHLPPLRDRKEDIPFLVDKFLDVASKELHKKKPTVPKQLYTLLSTYGFPGNVRELRSMVFDAMSVHETGTLSMDSFRSKIHKEDRLQPGAIIAPAPGLGQKVLFSSNLPTLREIQEILIQEALKAADGNQTIAAGILGMTRRALNNRLSRQ